jgi:hypothetical protein
MTALLKPIREHDVKAERLDVGTNRNMRMRRFITSRRIRCKAKFSMEFCMSSLLLYRGAEFNEFTDETVHRP